MTRLCAWRGWHRGLLIAIGGLIAVLALGAGSHSADAQVARRTAVHSPAIVLTAAETPNSTASQSSTTATTTPSGSSDSSSSSSGGGPPGIQVGPGGTTTPSSPVSGSGGTVSGGSQPSPGLFDVTGHIEAAIDDWFRDLVTAALDPILTLLGHTLLATPDLTAQSRVAELWQMTEGIADSFLVLFVLVAAVAVNASLSLAGLAISTADSLSQAVLGQGVDPSGAAVVLRQLVLGSLAGGGIFVVLLGGVVAVLAIVLLATYVVRLALVVLLIVAAPICLVCHALPQTEGLARLWWRAFSGTLAVQVAQSLVLVTALRVFLASGGPANLGIASTGGLVDLLVSACLFWVLVKIPSWVSRVVFSGSRSHGGFGRVVRDVIIYKGAKALAAGVGL